MDQHRGTPYFPSEIAHELSIKRSTVKATLHRLRASGILKNYFPHNKTRAVTGFYVLPEINTQEILERLKEPGLHGIGIHIERPLDNNKRIYPWEQILDRIKSQLHDGYEIKKSKTCLTLTHRYGWRKLVFVLYYQKNSIRTWLNSSESPLLYREFAGLLDHLSVILGDIWHNSVSICDELGDSDDYKLLQIKEHKSVKLQVVKNQFSQIYEKHKTDIEKLRVETHIYPYNQTEFLEKALKEENDRINRIVDNANHKETSFKIETLITTVQEVTTELQSVKRENRELKSNIETLTGALLQYFKIQNENSPSDVQGGGPVGGQGGYTPPPEDPQSDFTGYG